MIFIEKYTVLRKYLNRLTAVVSGKLSILYIFTKDTYTSETERN